MTKFANTVERWLDLLPRRRRRRVASFALAIGIFLACLAARFALMDVLPPGLPYITFFFAVLLATLLSGLWPGVLVVVLSVAVAWRLLLRHQSAAQFDEAVAASIVFIVICSLIVAVVHFLNRTVERLSKAQDRAETQLYLTAMAEQRLKMLNDELKHRNKNTFALIAALVAQGSRRETDVKRFSEALRSRLMAMGTAQDLVLGSSLHGTDLKTLISKTLEPLIPPGGKRLNLKGPEFFLPTEVATPLALVIHELGTNCIKHGSWSADKGVTAVEWRLDDITGPDSQLLLEWRETRGPRVTAPERTGLGTLLIERTLPDSTVEREFLETGFVCKISLAIRNLNTMRNGMRTRRVEGDTQTLAPR